MILVNQHFTGCSFCGRKLPPRWTPIEEKGRLYCSEKCIRFEREFGLAPDAQTRPSLAEQV